MKYLDLPHSKKPISQLIMGSDYFTPDTIDNVTNILESYLAIGGNTIDTARIYCGGKSEEALGLWLRNQNNREQINIWTKGAHHNADGPRVNKQAIDEELKISLDKLQTDYVELYALHRDDPDVEVGPIVEALNEHVEAGRIHAFGGSNWTWERLAEANRYAAEHGLQGFSFSSPNLSLAKAKEPYWANCISVDAETLAWHEQSKLPLFSWSSQARGFFTGRFARDNFDNADLVRVFYNDANWERYDRAEKLAKEKGVSTIQIALAYVLNQPFLVGAVIGPQNDEEMRSCGEATEIELTYDELQWLDLRK